MSVFALSRLRRRGDRLRWPRWFALTVQLVMIVAIAASPTTSVMPSKALPVAAETLSTATGVCGNAIRTITYDVAAFQTVIPINGWGDHLPDGLIYALSNVDAVPNKDDILANPNLTEPLVIRAAVGDCIKVNFRNEIAGKRVGMHVDGVSRDPKDSDGARIGYNPDTTVPTGQSITYTWYAQREGQYVINDYGSGTNFPLATTNKGLYGALVVLPQGATWHDPRTGNNLLNAQNKAVGARLFADVHVPGASNDFRDYALIFMDENEGILDRNGRAPVFPLTGFQDSTFGFNYRSEPLRNRLLAVLEHRGDRRFDTAAGQFVTGALSVTLPNGTAIKPEDHFCDGYVPDLYGPGSGGVVPDPGALCIGEESHLQSWPFGDQGKLTRKLNDGTIVVDTDNLIPKAYANDPLHVRLINPGIKETHPFHQHTNRWFLEPKDPGSIRLDVQSVGPGQTFDLLYEGGAGNIQGTPGDQIFHCHLYPHFAQGFWGDLRVFDRLRAGPEWAALNQKYPDGTPIEELKQLPDRIGQIQTPDVAHPGFPLFVKGDYLQRAYRAPYTVVYDRFQFGPNGDNPNYRRPGDTVRTGTDIERANMALKADGSANPGAFFLDPCPPGVPERTYYPASIDAKIVYNKAGWYDPEGKLYVEAPPDPATGKTALDKADEIRQAINNGQIQPEPYTIRSRIGECVNLRTTNATYLDDDPNVPLDIHAGPGGDAFHEPTVMTEVSTHVHLVRFDELGTDGTSVAWNYVQAPMNGQTYGYRWFVDEPLRTVFFHDHQYANTHQQHGMWSVMNVEPADATWHDPKTGLETNGVGTVADIHTPSGPDFREFTVHLSDFVPQFDAAGNPINPPSQPDMYAADQGVMGVNYRSEPFPTRINSQSVGPKAEPAYVFSSAVHGDPSTPIFRAYQRDPVVFRVISGAHEEVHNFNLAGHRWLSEPDDPNSNLYDTQAFSLAEFFNFEIQGNRPRQMAPNPSVGRELAREAAQLPMGATIIAPMGAGPPGDYLYSDQPLNDLWVGAWGLMRVPAKQVSDLQPLPDNPAPPAGLPGEEWPALRPADNIAPAPDPGQRCPVGASQRNYKISLVQQKVVYNAAGDNDPNGVVYVLDSDLDKDGKPKSGTAVKPLFIRANEGDCVVVDLTNRLPSAGIPVHVGDPLNPIENSGVANLVNGVATTVQATWPSGNRASMRVAGLARYDVTKSDGSAVGYNFDSTTGPGQTIQYQFYIDTKDMGVANFQNLANVRGTRHHGAWGGIVAEPKGAVYLNPASLQPLASGEAAVIRYPVTNLDGTTSFKYNREFVVDIQDGLNLFNKNGILIPPEEAGEYDAEDQGEKGINYRSEPFRNRLAKDPEIANVFSSQVHGDPATPVFRAYVGDPVTVRVLNSQDLPRVHTFGLFGHEWPHEFNDPFTTINNAEGELNTSRAFNLQLIGGAGGPQQAAGDYLYNDRNLFHMLSGGIWGLLRVHDSPLTDLRPLPIPFQGQYYSNIALAGTPVVTRTDSLIDFNWGEGSPDPLIPANKFSVRWTTSYPFAAGNYQFHTFSDDGVKLWVDGALLIDDWSDHPAREKKKTVALTPGQHEIKVEYFENGWDAQVKVWWETLTPPNSPTKLRATVTSSSQVDLAWEDSSDNEAGFRVERKVGSGGTYAPLAPVGPNVTAHSDTGANPEVTYYYRVVAFNDIGDSPPSDEVAASTPVASAGFQGQYFGGMTLSGAPALVRTDATIDFNWGTGSPDPRLPVDRFSVRWTGSYSLTAGTYRFHALADDGIRLWVDGTLAIDDWSDHAARERTRDVALGAGGHQIKVEYYENGWDSRAKVWWEALSPPSAPTLLAATVVSARQVDLSWVDNSDNETGFRLERKIGSSSTYNPVAILGPGVTAYSDTDLAPFTVYNYRIFAFNTVGDSTGSNGVSATTPESPPGFIGHYFANKALSGTPALIRSDAAIDFSWGTGSPGSSIPVDRFSARWTGDFSFSAGTYRFHTLADDGIRLWVNGVPVLDDWSDHAARERVGDVALAAGRHQVIVEYYENGWDASAKVWWEPLALPTAPTGLTANAASFWQVHLGWTDSSATEAGFRIERKTGPAGTYAPIGTVGPNVASFADTTVVANTTYSYRVYAYNAIGDSATFAEASTSTPAGPAGFQGQYYSNMTLSGTPTLTRTDATIDFNWGTGSPAPGLPVDRFSARWVGTFNFAAAGNYRFHTLADDGVKLWVDGVLVVNDWSDHSARERTGDVSLTAGAHQIRVEYYENGWDAQAKAWWEAIP